MCEEGVSQDINDRKQKRDDPEEKEADGARETKVMEQDIYGTERRPVWRDAQRHLVEGGEVRENRGQVTRSPEPAVRSLHFIPLLVGSH